jgi:hypothetical protein
MGEAVRDACREAERRTLKIDAEDRIDAANESARECLALLLEHLSLQAR